MLPQRCRTTIGHNGHPPAVIAEVGPGAKCRKGHIEAGAQRGRPDGVHAGLDQHRLGVGHIVAEGPPQRGPFGGDAPSARALRADPL